MDALEKKRIDCLILIAFTIVFISILEILNVLSIYSMIPIGILSILNLLLFSIFIKRNCGSYINFSMLFFILLYFFHFGHVLLACFEEMEIVKYGKNSLNLFSEENNYYAFCTIYYVFSAMCIGALWGQGFRSYNALDSFDSCSIRLQVYDLYKKAKMFLWITFPVEIVFDTIRLYLSLHIGHLRASTIIKETFPSIIITYGNLSTVGMGVLIICLKNRPQQQKLLFYLFAAYHAFMMMGGNRGSHISVIIVLFLLYMKSHVGEIKILNIFNKIILAYLLVSLLIGVIAAGRNTERSIVDIVDASFEVASSDNVILHMFYSFGLTGYTAECVLLYWLENYPPSYGLSYIFGPLFPLVHPIAIRIGTREDVEQFHECVAYGLALQNHGMLHSEYTNIGGSMIGEFLFNFGEYGGIIFSIVVGYIIGRISRQIEFNIRNNEFGRMGYYILILVTLVFYTRGYFVDSLRAIAMGIILWWFVQRISLYKIAGRAGAETWKVHE